MSIGLCNNGVDTAINRNAIIAIGLKANIGDILNHFPALFKSEPSPTSPMLITTYL